MYSVRLDNHNELRWLYKQPMWDSQSMVPIFKNIPLVICVVNDSWTCVLDMDVEQQFFID